MKRYSREPEDGKRFTRRFDAFYGRFGGIYDAAVRFLPVWRSWLLRTLPHLRGPRVLEVSFGTGFLLTQCAARYEAHGLDLNERMVGIARTNLARAGLTARLCRGTVEALPYPDGSFDSVVSTMAFSGYPDARKALGEMTRVLRPDGALVMLDVNFPKDGNRIGTRLVELWKSTGDIVRDMHGLFREFRLDCSDTEVGGCGSIHLFVATRRPEVTPAQEGPVP